MAGIWVWKDKWVWQPIDERNTMARFLGAYFRLKPQSKNA